MEGGPNKEGSAPMYWVDFQEKDFETPVKDFQNIAIGFKISMDMSINVEGRSYTFKQEFQVDPKDKFEATLRSRTKTWSLFMTRSRCSCVVKVEYKKKGLEDGFIPPNSFDKTFDELGIKSGAQLVIIEMRNINADVGDMSEGMDEDGGEEEQDEDALEQEAAREEEAKDEDADDAKIVDDNAPMMGLTNDDGGADAAEASPPATE